MGEKNFNPSSFSKRSSPVDGRSDLQREAGDLSERLEEVKRSIESIKIHLNGLKFKPASSEESSCADLPPERSAELAERERSISWIVDSQIDIALDCLDNEDLRDARYFMLSELIDRAKEKADLLEKIMVEINDEASDFSALQRMADEYILRLDTLFYLDEQTGKVILKKLDQETMAEAMKSLEGSLKWQKYFAEQISEILKSSRLGIDPGAVLISSDRKNLSFELREETVAAYAPPAVFKGELSKTGLILMPTFFDPSILRHEFLHFEDRMLETKPRPGLAGLISEINSWFLQHGRDIPQEMVDKYFDELKEIINEGYVEPRLSGLRFKDLTKDQISRSVDVVRRLYKNGISREAISSILMQIRDFDELLQWEKVSDDEMKRLSAKNFDSGAADMDLSVAA